MSDRRRYQRFVNNNQCDAAVSMYHAVAVAEGADEYVVVAATPVAVGQEVTVAIDDAGETRCVQLVVTSSRLRIIGDELQHELHLRRPHAPAAVDRERR